MIPLWPNVSVPHLALEQTSHTTGFFLWTDISGVWLAAHLGR